MNILLFCSNPVNGGTARVFYELACGLEQRLAPSDRLFCCINAGNDVEIYRKLQHLYPISMVSAETLFPNSYGGSLPRRIVNSLHRTVAYRKVLQENIRVAETFIRDNGIDSVIIHNGGYVGDDLCNQMLTAAYHCRAQVKNRIYVLHNDMDKGLLAKLRFRGYDRKVSREASEIVTVSNYTKEHMLAASFLRKDVSVLYNGMEIGSALSREQKLERIPLDSSKKNVLMIGNFYERKGQKEYIQAAAVLSKLDENYCFTIIGNAYDEAYYQSCMNLIDQFGLTERFTIYQKVNNASEYIDLFDVLAVPSLYDESFGLISVEAMAWGRPVVAFACGGIPEVVVDGRDGYVVPIGDYDTMAQRIHDIEQDVDLRTWMGRNCREDYEQKFSVDAMTERYMALLKNE